MKQSIMSALFFALFYTTFTYTINPDALWVEQEDDRPCTATTQNIYDRYYLIARLTKVVTLLQSINDQCRSLIEQEVLPIDANLFHHAEIIACIRRMNTTQNLSPLWDIWHCICHYTKIDNHQFIKEFTLLIGILTKSIARCSPQLEAALVKSSEHTFVLADQGKNKVNNKLYPIVFRFFLLHRLSKVKKLLTPYKTQTMAFASSDNMTHIIIDSSIRNCYKQMYAEQSFEPLFIVWEKFEQFDKINDLSYSKDFIVLVLVVYWNLLLQEEYGYNTVNPLEELTKDSTIADLLELLDVYVEQANIITLHTKSDLPSHPLFQLGANTFQKFKNWLLRYFS